MCIHWFHFQCINMYACRYLHVSERYIWPLGIGLTVSSENLSIGASYETKVFWKNSKHFQVLSHLFCPRNRKEGSKKEEWIGSLIPGCHWWIHVLCPCMRQVLSFRMGPMGFTSVKRTCQIGENWVLMKIMTQIELDGLSYS